MTNSTATTDLTELADAAVLLAGQLTEQADLLLGVSPAEVPPADFVVVLHADDPAVFELILERVAAAVVGHGEVWDLSLGSPLLVA